MLVLTRFMDEEVWIDVPEGAARRIVVKVVKVERGRARIGFEADDDVVIDRSEIAVAKDRIVRPR